MAKFDYKHAKEEIAQINAIVETCHDAVKEKCFELLFAAVFGHQSSTSVQSSAGVEASKKVDDKLADSIPAAHTKKLSSNVLAFTRKYSISEDELGKLFMLDHEPLLPVYKLPSQTSQAQLYKA
jgi:hypothetical protein